MGKRILIASDGSKGSEGALRLGHALAHEKGYEIEVLSVAEPVAVPAFIGLEALPDGYTVLDLAREDTLRNDLRLQLEELGADAAGWPLTVRTGPPVPSIARHAHDRGDDLILLGTGPQAGIDRWLRSETALRVVHLSAVPVVAVPPDTRELPRRALVAVDFSEYSLRAARVARELMAPGGVLFLVHVTWEPNELSALPSLGRWKQAYDAEAAARLKVLAEELRGSGVAHVESVVEAGDPALELVSLADRLNVDLVAAGSHGRGFFGRVLMGSVSARLMRGSRCSVLLAPPALLPPELAGASSEAGGRAP